MRDLKRQQQPKRKTRQNRAKAQKKPLNLRKMFHRALRVAVVSFSGAMIVVGGFLVVQFLLASDLFRVDQISVQGGRQLPDKQVVALSDIHSGVNTFSLDLDLIGRKIEENPWVREARVRRIFPRQISVVIEERQPVAIVNLGYLYYLDAKGEVFKVLDADDKLDYPIITGFNYQKIQQHDQRSAADLKHIVLLLADLQKRQQFTLDQVSEVHREPGGGFALFTLLMSCATLSA